MRIGRLLILMYLLFNSSLLAVNKPWIISARIGMIRNHQFAKDVSNQAPCLELGFDRLLIPLYEDGPGVFTIGAYVSYWDDFIRKAPRFPPDYFSSSSCLHIGLQASMNPIIPFPYFLDHRIIVSISKRYLFENLYRSEGQTSSMNSYYDLFSYELGVQIGWPVLKPWQIIVTGKRIFPDESSRLTFDDPRYFLSIGMAYHFDKITFN